MWSLTSRICVQQIIAIFHRRPHYRQKQKDFLAQCVCRERASKSLPGGLMLPLGNSQGGHVA